MEFFLVTFYAVGVFKNSGKWLVGERWYVDLFTKENKLNSEAATERWS